MEKILGQTIIGYLNEYLNTIGNTGTAEYSPSPDIKVV